MARTSGVWGIDIGQTALKALRCQLSDNDDGTLEATAFDFIEYPKILSQPDSDPETLIREALAQFLSRNKIKGDRIAISVAGQSGLARFFKPPPVDKKKVPDIVKYEARQQIPFPLEDVVWDWQQLGGTEVDGFALDSEIGLFAMKREQVFKSIKPFKNAAIELDVIQLSPLAIYNTITHDLLDDAKREFNPDDPTESFVILSIGTDTTDLVVTNGHRVWQRSLALGGNHFTKQITKELKLTFAKAEHLKRNARQAEDPKTVFQAMRPVFNDLVTEVQRSLGFFQNIDRKAKLGKIVLLGNTTKLPGLQQYLAKNLDFEVLDYPNFKRLGGESVVSSPSFKDNVLAYGVCYGLCLQAMGTGKLRTNLLPREFLTQRLIAAKKPWTLTAVAALLLAWSFNYFFYYNSWYTVHPQRAEDKVTWASAVSEVQNAKTRSDSETNKDKTLVEELTLAKALGDEVAGNSDRRLAWLELLTAVQASLPFPDPKKYRVESPPDPAVIPFDQRPEIHIEYIESEFFPELREWFSDSIRTKYLEGKRVVDGMQAGIAGANGPVAGGVPAAPGADPAAAAQAPPPAAPANPADPNAGLITGPDKDGWVIELKGYHFFNAQATTSGSTHVINTLLKNLEYGDVELATGPGRPKMRFKLKELGINYPTLVISEPINFNYQIENPRYEKPELPPGPPGMPQRQVAPPVDPRNPPFFKAPRYDFTIQFSWQPEPLTKRLKKREEQERVKRDQENRNAASAPANPVR